MRQAKTRKTRPILERFWEKVERTPNCWLWKGFRDKNGRASFYMDGQPRSASRISFMLTYGSIPFGKFVLHKCDVPFCVNPTHLELGNQSMNMKQAVTRHRSKWYTKKSCKKGHEYNLQNTKYGFRRGWRDRVCLLCRREGSRRYKLRLKHEKSLKS